MADGRFFENDLVSVITPVYNAGHFISQTINSVLAQTYKNIEVVLLDDCSKDNTAEIIKGYLKEHSNIIYHLHERNLGAAVARNTALEIAQGRYVAFLDSDDVWKPNKIEKQIALMKAYNASIAYTAIEMIDESGTLIKKKRNIIDRIDYKLLLRNTMLATSSMIIDRYQLGDFRMPLQRSGQDYATWLKLMRNGTIAYGINEALVQYRISKGSLSSYKFKSIKQVWQIQTKNEGIHKLPATWHVICFCFNAFKKYFF